MLQRWGFAVQQAIPRRKVHRRDLRTLHSRPVDFRLYAHFGLGKRL